MYLYIYIYVYTHTCELDLLCFLLLSRPPATTSAEFQGVWLQHNVDVKGRNSHVHRGFPGKLDSSNVSRDNVSREIGRTPEGTKRATSVNVQLPCLQKDLRTGSISRDVNFPRVRGPIVNFPCEISH